MAKPIFFISVFAIDGILGISHSSMETFGFDRIQAQSVTEMRVRTFCEIEKEKLSGELQKFRGKMELFQE